jgi:DNA repair protein REV1
MKFYTILMSYTDDLQAVSVDEVLIDVTSTVAQTKAVPTGVDDGNDCTSMDIAKELAEDMRAQIMATTGCEGTVCVVFNHKPLTSCSASIGITSNIILARLATQRAKPAGSPAAITHIVIESAQPPPSSSYPANCLFFRVCPACVVFSPSRYDTCLYYGVNKIICSTR